ncbi:hypothetical protein TVAG_179840 [Trichomonas vaginalis G3]|uniref:TPR Domain containing protein n=1 Tax=Trichomonas vaginalis (strain ATCC PRA-98 / G3) TaxID=412133 RepID=A2F466_TRIV3|nr:tetratricopeptide repeat domain domain-containing protein [Trichomonas vaginalis G3]EAY00313.1 hypothetical protein TVAG_179840 [Trichomonas vaginalis G3]KAI5490886.1 tetratricopeptide repeat domain domain-containing protein [Trichomonas vaginalis G3]|eukprot:XP_001313242.1 hypothetical protein [Trichomonas vaginalis G3]
MEEKIMKMAMNSSTYENQYKQGDALVKLGKPDAALQKFKSVCENLEVLMKANPAARIESHLIPMSLTKMADIYKDKKDVNKALALMKNARHFLEYMCANKPNREDEDSDEADNAEHYTLGALFVEMHKAFDMEDATPPSDAEEITRIFLEAKKKHEEETARKNIEKLKAINEARKEKLRNSRWARFVELVNDHPIAFAIGSVVFLSVFLIISLMMFTIEPPVNVFDQKRSKYEKNLPPDYVPPGQRHGHTHNHEHEKASAERSKAEQERLKKMMEDLSKYVDKEDLKQNPMDDQAKQEL